MYKSCSTEKGNLGTSGENSTYKFSRVTLSRVRAYLRKQLMLLDTRLHVTSGCLVMTENLFLIRYKEYVGEISTFQEPHILQL